MDQSRRNIALLSQAQALFLSTSVISVSTISLVGAELAPDARWATIPYALVTVGTALATIPASLLMKRIGRRNGFLLGVLFAVVAFSLGLGAVYTGVFTLLLFAGLFQGVAQASTQYFRFAAVEAVDPSEAGKAISWVLAGGVVAALFAPTLARFANQSFADVPYSGPYILMIVIAALTLVPIALIKLPKVSQQEVTGTGRHLTAILGCPKTIVAMFSAGTGWLLMVMLMGAAPLAMHAKGFHFDHSSQVIQWHMLGMYVPSFFTAFLVGRLGVTKLLITGCVTLFVAALVGWQGESFMHYMISLILLGIGWNFMFVGGTTLLTQTYTPEEKAKVQGLNEFMVFSMAGCGAFLSGYLVKSIGWHTLMEVAMVTILAALVVVLFFSARYQRNDKRKLEAKS